jgi:hypothetical protein
MKKNQIPTKDAILVHLKSGITNFKFEKKDGELREMNATLVSSQIDPRFHKETNPNPHGGNPDLVVCWDVDQVGWRSFNVSSLKEYNGKVRDV